MTSGLVDRHPLKEKRRANKPLLERKRRARINDSLTDLKHLVLSSLNKDVSKYTKMEKVDILDMTVRYLKGRCLDQRQEDCSSMYRAGYRECTKEMYQNIMTMDGLDHSVKCRILSNLANNQREDNKLSPPPSPTMSNESLSPVPSPPSPMKMFDPVARHYVNNNSRLFVPQFHQQTVEHLPPLVRKTPSAPGSVRSIPPMLEMNMEHHHLSKDIARLPSKPLSPLWRPW